MNSQSKVQSKVNLHKPIKGQLGQIEAKMVHKKNHMQPNSQNTP
jgi:hypothetical protein